MAADVPASAVSLVSPRRFGAALVAARTAEGAPLTAMSRRCDGWWRPDELAAFETGTAQLDDSVVLAVARLYHLKGCPVPSGDAAELLLDRSTAPDVDFSVSRSPERSPEAVAPRILALAGLLGADLVGPDSLEVLAEAFGTTTEHIRTSLVEVADDEVAAASEALGGRVVVPITGILVAYTSAGSVVLGRPVGRRGRRTDRRPGAAPLRSLVVEALVGS